MMFQSKRDVFQKSFSAINLDVSTRYEVTCKIKMILALFCFSINTDSEVPVIISLLMFQSSSETLTWESKTRLKLQNQFSKPDESH